MHPGLFLAVLAEIFGGEGAVERRAERRRRWKRRCLVLALLLGVFALGLWLGKS